MKVKCSHERYTLLSNVINSFDLANCPHSSVDAWYKIGERLYLINLRSFYLMLGKCCIKILADKEKFNESNFVFDI